MSTDTESEKIKVLTLGDHPFSPSGVGTQTKYVVEALLRTGKFKFISLGGAVKHPDYQPQKPQGWEEDWIIHPVDGYGNQEIIRSLIRTEKPDILWFMTDPRFYGWLWEIENEIRPLMPMVYYHVWDNYPYPKFNRHWYESTDVVASISKVTADIVETVTPEVEHHHIPHAVNTEIFKKHDEEDVEGFRKEHFAEDDDRMIFFWSNRNARRKQSGTLIFWFKEFLDIVGHDKARLIMHTEVKDPNGQDLEAIIRELDLTDGEVMFSEKKIDPIGLSMMYNMSDCTINIADAEGFGLSTLESLACEVPIIVNMTGGLQEQVTDGENWFGIGIEPASKAIIGSQEIPWIYEDRMHKQDFLDAMIKFYNMSKKERENLGRLGREHVHKNYNFDNFNKKWVELMFDIHERYGSWETRKNYKSWKLLEV